MDIFKVKYLRKFPQIVKIQISKVEGKVNIVM